MKLSAQIEAVLFVSSKPMTIKRLALELNTSLAEIEKSLNELKDRLNVSESGLTLIRHASSVQLATHPDTSECVSSFVRDELKGELTRSATETLSIIAYRGPLKKEEIEQIRGVHCTIALRNLLMRGLIEEKIDSKGLQSTYSISLELLRHLGLSMVTELPHYEHFKSLKLSGEGDFDAVCAT